MFRRFFEKVKNLKNIAYTLTTIGAESKKIIFKNINHSILFDKIRTVIKESPCTSQYAAHSNAQTAAFVSLNPLGIFPATRRW